MFCVLKEEREEEPNHFREYPEDEYWNEDSVYHEVLDFGEVVCYVNTAKRFDISEFDHISSQSSRSESKKDRARRSLSDRAS
jgi:hypothetical protein